jgi:uncharacterized protein (TIGR03435 family)
VKENKTGGEIHMNFPMGNDDVYVPNGGYMHVTSLPLLGYLDFAYKLDSGQRSAVMKQLPDWARSAKYDVEARVEGDPGKDGMRMMTRALLADRFQLKIHTESHEAKVFDLVLAKPGKTGPTLKLHPSGDPQCLQGTPNGFFSPCRRIGFNLPNESGSQRMSGRNVPLAQFVDYSSGLAGRPVIDKTGLTGTYDFTLEFVPSSKPTADSSPDAQAPAGSTFTEAVTDQMGLKLVPDTGPVEAFVIDHIEKPSPD